MNRIPHFTSKFFKNIDSKWICIFTLFVINVLLYENSEPLSNYYDSSPYYLFIIIVPSLFLVPITALLIKKLDPRVLFKMFLLIETILIITYGITAMMFQTYNGDNLIYITGYMMIYHKILFWSMLALMLPLLYLATYTQITLFKQEKTKFNVVLNQQFNNFLSSIFISFILLVIARYWSYGISHILVGTLLLFALIEDPLIKWNMSETTGEKKHISTTSEPNTQDSKEAHLNVKSDNSDIYNSVTSSRAKNGIIIFILFIFVATIAYLWPTDYIFLWQSDEGPQLMYFIRDSHQTIDFTIKGLLVFITVGSVLKITDIIDILINKLSRIKNREFLLGISAIILAFFLWTFMMLGFSPFPIRFSLLITPWIMLLMQCWIILILLKRNVESPGLLSAILFISSLAIWGMIALGIEADSDFSPILWISMIIGTGFLIFFLYFFVEPRLILASKKNETEVRISKKESDSSVRKSKINIIMDQINNFVIKRRHIDTQVRVSLLVLLILTPVLSILVPTHSSSNFQILANVDNNCIFYLADPMTRVDQNYKPNFGLKSYNNPNNTIEIVAAKNEFESIQIVMLPIRQSWFALYDIYFDGFAHSSDPNSVVIDPTGKNFTSYRLDYVKPLNNLVPDILYNYSSTTISDGKNHPFWFTFYIPEDINSGSYNGTLHFEVVDRKTQDTAFYRSQIIQFNIKLKVLNFKIPTKPSLKSNFGFSSDYPHQDIVMDWYQDHRMMHWSFFSLPRCTLNADGTINTIDFTSMNDRIQEIYEYGTYTLGFHFAKSSILPVTPFQVDGTWYNHTNYTTCAPKSTYDVTYTEYFSQLESYLQDDAQTYLDDFGNNISWFSDVYLNGEDEIEAREAEKRNKYIEEYRWLREDIGISIPIMQTVMHPKGDIKEQIVNNVDILCWHTVGFEMDFITEAKSQNKEIWIYTTRGPRFPVPTVATSAMATQLRALPWQCFVFNYTHYLIWDVATPYDGMNGYAYQGWNGGSLLYRVPNGFALSTRMELVREGFEDYEYFKLLKLSVQHLKDTDPTNISINIGEDLLNQVNKLFGPGYDAEMDYRKVYNYRYEIGTLLERICIL
ncbi:MAG: hypothetical protein GF364_08120 [Candidatus Lokiarchaeota archaeon]|nr:hypothetical protein [Candidatus Lokiarchaeota archaeon]